MALKELIYTSLCHPENVEADVKGILDASERNNAAVNITGLLLFDGQRFIQILEGEAEHVNALYEKICLDPRHTALELLHTGNIKGRSFDNWRMAYESLPLGLLDELAENMAIYSMEQEGEALDVDDTFGARLNGMFMDAIAAE